MKIIKFDQVVNKMSDTETEDCEPCPVIQEQCKYYIYEYDANGKLAISFCAHPDNPNDSEGNCRHSLCPLTAEE